MIERLDREIVENGLSGNDIRPLRALAVRLFEEYWINLLSR